MKTFYCILCVICVSFELYFTRYCSNISKVWWELLHMFCWKFLSLYSSARIFEIGYDLTKLSPNFGTTVFFGTQCSMRLPSSELAPRVARFCGEEWQDIWHSCENNKLHAIYPTVGCIPLSKNLTRHQVVIINRL